MKSKGSGFQILVGGDGNHHRMDYHCVEHYAAGLVNREGNWGIIC